jgi:hypothetical protein
MEKMKIWTYFVIRYWHPVCRHVALFLEMSVERGRDVLQAERTDGRGSDRVDRGAERRVNNVIELVVVIATRIWSIPVKK